MGPKRLVIIDGYALLYRAFFATRYLSTSDGRPTNALFGFTAMLFQLLEKVEPHAMVVALDAPGKTFRHDDYAEYKGTRKPTADELKVQLNDARDLIAALGIPAIEVKGFEADDVVGTISRMGEENGYETTIVTGDLDSLQLVDAMVSVMAPKTGVTETVTYTPADVVERYGFGPEFIADFKALKGDTSDNIPGVPGIGDKGAAELITGFGTIESMIEKFDELPAKYQKKIAGNQEQMRKSKWLATIVRDVPLKYDFALYKLTEDQLTAAISMLEKLEFRGLVKKAPSVLGRYLGEGRTTEPAVEVIEEALAPTEGSCVDYASLASALSAGPYSVFFAAPPIRDDLFQEEIRLAYVGQGKNVFEVPELAARELLQARPADAILHDAKPTYRFQPAGAPAPGFDTQIAAFVLRSERSSYALRDLVQGYLEVSAPTTPFQLANGLFLLKETLSDRLERESQTTVFEGIELPLVPILADMERLGIAADRGQFREFSGQLQTEIAVVQARVHKAAGREFTIGSPKQLGEVLFDEMKLPGAQKTKTGYATGVEVLADLAAEYPIVADVLSWRELTKLKSTYADALERLVRPDGRIHTTYHQTGAATGRLSSNDPNLQNIPIRTELGRSIRKAFHAAEGFRLASLDYSQIELRVLAHMCEEPALVRAFNDREDVHTVTARAMFHENDVTKEQRRMAKMLNYAVLYGVSEFGLAQQLGAGFSVSEARALITQYNERFPSVKEFTNSIIAEARSKGFTTTLRGRRRHFPDIHAARINDRKAAERQAMNAPIQGTAADMLKLAMIHSTEVLRGSSTRMLLNVHDELVFEVPIGGEDIIPKLQRTMEHALELNVPTEVDAKIGQDWNEMTPLTS
jgi:DNA polymerase-1